MHQGLLSSPHDVLPSVTGADQRDAGFGAAKNGEKTNKQTKKQLKKTQEKLPVLVSSSEVTLLLLDLCVQAESHVANKKMRFADFTYVEM